MHRLERITLHNWNLIEATDIEIRGTAALIGPTGAGKSSIIDAIQTVITGNNARSLELNASAGGRSNRTVLNYCLGLDDQVSDRPARERCDTVLALTFRDDKTGDPVSIGVLLSADRADTRAQTRALFIAQKHAFRISDHIGRDKDGDEIVLNNESILERLRKVCGSNLKLYSTATKYVEDYLVAMRRRGAAPNAKQFLRNFANAIAFRQIDDPTAFVRKYVLEEDELKLERVRSSIENWRQLEEEVKRLETMLQEIAATRSRLQTWARQHIALNTYRFVAAHAERLRLDIELSRVAQEITENTEALERELAARRRDESAIEELTDAWGRKKAMLGESGQGAKLRALDAEADAEEQRRRQALKVLRDTTTLYAGIALLDQIRERVPIRLHEAVDAAVSLRRHLGHRQPETLIEQASEFVALERRIRRITEAEDSLRQQRDALSEDIVGHARKMEELQSQLAGAARDGAVLSPHVRRLLDDLSALGIRAVPLPDVVEVKGPEWAYALEALLGAGREALIVPADRVEQAFDHMYRHRAHYHGCRLVNTRKSAGSRSGVPAGSIAEIIETQNEDARIFIERQVGRFVRARTLEELERHEYAVLPNGKTTAGLGLRVFRDLRPILGKTAQAGARAAMAAELQTLEVVRRKLTEERSLVDSALGIIGRLREQAEDPEGLSIEAAAEETRRAARVIARINKDRGAVEDEATKALRSEIEEIERDIEAYRTEIRDEIEPRILERQTKDRDLQVKLQRLKEVRGDCERQEQEAQAIEADPEFGRLITCAGEAETIARARDEIAAMLQAHSATDTRRTLADFRNRAEQELKTLPARCDDNRRRAVNQFADFVRTWLRENPLPENAGEATKLFWAVKEEVRLERHELRPHRERVERARRDVEAALKEDLLTKLAEKFKSVDQQIRRLNGRLERHTFTGQTYSFSREVNPSFKPLYRLAQDVADNPERGFLAVEADEQNQTIKQGLAQIDEILQRHDGTKELEDYRNYFTFELWMTNERGTKTSLSARAGSGSGGQKQAPYYIAIAASMASVYYPMSMVSEADGMGLVVFDEAFNKLDIANTQALLSFFADVKLQVVVAAPEQKRGDFLEVIDTIISINRSPGGEHLYIDVEQPGPRARAELAHANPARLGLEHFRQQLDRAAE